ncbi:MAG: alpha/beta hydrolase [Alphaproteobacteria bacterium]|nr:alpha/beta hydrolase [Alphaproteobacteria bacterium]
MKISEADILLIPGYGDTPAGHWMHRWAEKMPTARMVDLGNPHRPVRKTWVEAVTQAVRAAERPVVLVAHSLGTNTVVHAAHALPKDTVKAAFLVAPTDLSRDAPKPAFEIADFLPLPKGPLPFPARIVASRSDPHCAFETAKDWAHHWGAHFQDAGDAGHINLESGHGPWPEGLMSFAYLMKTL